MKSNAVSAGGATGAAIVLADKGRDEEMLLQLEHMQKTYGPFALDVSLKLEEGQVVGLIGANGAGKSTTFKAILGLVYPEAGTCEVLGKPVRELTAADKQQIGVVLSDTGFSGYLTVKDLIPIMEAMYADFSKEDFEEKCRRFNIPFDKQIKEFSTGMKAKVKVLVALSHNAKLLILDEPTAGLDVVVRQELLDMLREYIEDGTKGILISSHISSDLEGLCDELYMIDNGKIVMHEETDVLLSDYGVIKVTPEQYEQLDKQYLLKVKKEHLCYRCLTNQKEYYAQNYPNLIIEKGSIDESMMLMLRGEEM